MKVVTKLGVRMVVTTTGEDEVGMRLNRRFGLVLEVTAVGNDKMR